MNETKNLFKNKWCLFLVARLILSPGLLPYLND